jgi:hypothetical protein
MKEERSTGNRLKIPPGLFQEGVPETSSVLSALLDAQLIFNEPGLSLEQFHPLWNPFFPDRPLEAQLRELGILRWVEISRSSTYAVPSGLCLPLAREMDGFMTQQTIRLPHGDMAMGQLLDDFSDYYGNGPGIDLPAEKKSVKAWGGMVLFTTDRAHWMLIRPHPVRLRAQEEAYLLVLCSLPETVSLVLAGLFVNSPALRQRVALFDLEGGRKLNLTRSEVFVHFERFLKRVHGVRIGPDPALTQSLLDAGLLSFDKG